MNIEEYIEEDEEPPLLLSPRPSHGKCFHTKSNIRVMISAFFSDLFTQSLLCFSVCVLQVFGCGRTAPVQCRWGDGCACHQCPAGEQPSKVRLQ